MPFLKAGIRDFKAKRGRDLRVKKARDGRGKQKITMALSENLGRDVLIKEP